VNQPLNYQPSPCYEFIASPQIPHLYSWRFIRLKAKTQVKEINETMIGAINKKQHS
jgi:hypothetical protein